MNSDRVAELIADIFRETILLSHSLPEIVDPYTNPPIAKVAYKYLVYREALIWRSEELARSARSELLENRLVSSTILTRSLLECAAGFHYLTEKISRAIAEQSISGLDEAAMKLLLGSRWTDWDHQAISVLTLIDKMDKKYPGARKLYDQLSEIAHPNWSGTAGAYAQRDDESHVTTFNAYRDGARLLDNCLIALSLDLQIISKEYNSASDSFFSFNDFCNEEFENE